jgi:hypothetical protein
VKKNWSEWLPFPDPRSKGYVTAPFGPGVFELRLRATKERILYGRSKNVAYRMTSLLPLPDGTGSRSSSEKMTFLSEHLPEIEYRTIAAADEDEAKQIEVARKPKGPWRFPS